MTDVNSIVLADETPQVDALQQRLPVDVEDETGLDTSYVNAIGDRDANEADLIDQAIVVLVCDR